MTVVEILNAELYRDGGSYAFSFLSDNGGEYEFFMQVLCDKDFITVGYSNPVIYFKNYNSGKIVKEFSWEQASEYVSKLNYEGDTFFNLVKIVNNHGQRT